MNIWTFVHFTAFIVYFLLILYIIVKNPNAVINWMLAMVFICMCYWSGTNAALYNVYITAQAADFILRT
ncbi:MAG TPA: hypothetical protein PK247_06270, partial [Candidatus Goldiibacteriota bacterium]|nr:hypothetical protein [Candidatus Goldiibacteriota bacterium]